MPFRAKITCLIVKVTSDMGVWGAGFPVVAISRQSGGFEGPSGARISWRFATQKVAILESYGDSPICGDFWRKCGDFW